MDKMKKGIIITNRPEEKGTITKRPEVAASAGLPLESSKWLSQSIDTSNRIPMNNYSVLADSAPAFGLDIKIGDWNTKDHLIALQIQETKDLIVLDWLSELTTRIKAVKTSALESLEKDRIAITFWNESHEVLARLVLNDAVLLSHRLMFEKEYLTFEAVFKYGRYEKMVDAIDPLL